MTKRSNIIITGLARMPTLEDVYRVQFIGVDSMNTEEAWEFVARELPEPGTPGMLVPADEFDSFECVLWSNDDGSWYLPADIFQWKSA